MTNQTSDVLVIGGILHMCTHHIISEVPVILNQVLATSVRQLFTIYTYVCLTNMGISLGSLYLYSLIGLVNDVPSESFLIYSILYCSLFRIQILSHSSQLMHNCITM